jgi:RNA polymerase-interacting CarD/CdnL/TRCF family regulator
VRGPPPRHPDEPKAELSALEGIIQDASELKVGDRLVYPNQGVCEVVGIEVKEIAGQQLEMVRMRREEDGAIVLVPKGKVPSVGLRRVASSELMEGVFHYLAAQFDDPELDWKIRHRDNADRLVAGGVLGIAEVVKGLHALSRIRPLPTKEREQYDAARHLLIGEVAVSLGVAAGLAEDYLDLALMPPAGTKFDLKPPPKPILLPSRPKKRRIVVEDEGDGLEGLGLDDLGIEVPGVETAEAGAEVAEGEAVEGEPVEGVEPVATDLDEAPAAAALPARPAPVERPAAAHRPMKLVEPIKAAAPARTAKPAAAKVHPAATPRKKPAAPARPAARPAPRAAPARKPAPKKSAPKKTGGKKR